MQLKILIVIMLFAQCSWAINFYPLPKSFTNTFRVIPSFGILKFQSLDLSSSGGSVKDMHEVIGLGIKWGQPYEGWGVFYNVLRSSVVSKSGSSFTTTQLTLDAIKWRGYVKIIDDQTSKMAFFGSVGQFFGHYLITTDSESNGITQLKKRLVSGVLIDTGVGFNYEFNPEWDIFLQVGYQWSMNEAITNIIGEASTDSEIKMAGAMIQLGTSLRI